MPSVVWWTNTEANRPFAQLLPGLETGHPVTVGQSPTCSFSVSDGREVLFLSPFRAVLGAVHVQVTDRPSPDAPSLTQANNCANGLLRCRQTFVGVTEQHYHHFKQGSTITL